MITNKISSFFKNMTLVSIYLFLIESILHHLVKQKFRFIERNLRYIIFDFIRTKQPTSW